MTPPPPTPSSLGLRARAALAVVSLVVAVAALAIVVVARADVALRDVERARFESATAQLADAVSYGVLARSGALLEAPLAAFAANAELIDVEIVADDAVLARRSGGSQQVAAAAPPAGGAIEVTARVSTRASPPGDDDGELAAFGVAVGGEPRVIGSVRARFSSVATERIQKKTRREILAASLALGVVGVAAAGALMTSIVRRVRKVADAAARVRKGEFSTTVDVGGGSVLGSGQDELGQLGADFNAMTRALSDQQRALAERESLAAIGRATAVIAHELKNPLGIVLGAAQIVGNESKPPAARAEAAKIVEEEVRRLSHTLEDLLSYARPRAPARTRVDVRAACVRAATRASLAGGPMHAEGKTVTVAPPSAGGDDGRARSERSRDEHALVDDGQLQQILLNLIQNAAQAGALTVRLAVEARANDKLGVIVDDDGPGIAADMREQLFLPFATTKQRGTGLGLAASRRIARDNGGDLIFEERVAGEASAPSAPGARFVVLLEPASPEKKKEPAPS